MKNTILKTKYIVIGLFLVLAVSCNSDDTIQATVASVKYASTNIEATFAHEGNTSAPRVNWNGDIGSFSIVTPIEGLTVNENTGELNWTNLLPEGIYEIKVIATNSAGQTTINLSIDNTLKGKFIGHFNEYPYSSVNLEIEFKENGVAIIIFVSSDPIILSGAWTKIGDEYIVNFLAQGDFSFKGSLTQTIFAATLEGGLYHGHNAVEINRIGDFNVELRELIIN
jgi:hypothetical protein